MATVSSVTFSWYATHTHVHHAAHRAHVHIVDRFDFTKSIHNVYVCTVWIDLVKSNLFLSDLRFVMLFHGGAVNMRGEATLNTQSSWYGLKYKR